FNYDQYYDATHAALSFEITDPTILHSFGNAGVHVRIENSDGALSTLHNTQSLPPVLTSGGPTCDDLYCIWLGGSFPLNARVDFRAHGQPDLLFDPYSEI